MTKVVILLVILGIIGIVFIISAGSALFIGATFHRGTPTDRKFKRICDDL